MLHLSPISKRQSLLHIPFLGVFFGELFFKGVILTATGSFFLEAFVLSSVFFAFDFSLFLSFPFPLSFTVFSPFPFFGDDSFFFAGDSDFFFFFGG